MNPGKLDKRITLQQREKTDDGQGGRKPGEWVDVVSVWAEFRTPNVKELALTGSIVSDLVRQVIIRRRPDVCRGWRVLYGTRTFEVQHTFDYDKQTTVLVCREVVK